MVKCEVDVELCIIALQLSQKDKAVPGGSCKSIGTRNTEEVCNNPPFMLKNFTYM